MRRHQGLFDRPHGRAQRGWDDGYDPSMEFYEQSNVYRRGPGAYLAAEHQAYNIQPGAQPYKLFISGVHPQTSEEGILNIFQRYGNPISACKTRNNFNEPIAFVEFASQREADSAIINLDRKPPLHWSVTYATSRKERYDPLSDLNEVVLGEIERQTPLHLPSSAAVVRRVAPPYIPTAPSTYPGPIPGDALSPVRRREEENLSLYPPCTVCTTPAKLVCIVCKTRYCSESCQSGDWPTHRNSCIPPPVLELAQPAVNNVVPMRVPSTATVTELPAPIRGIRANPNLSVQVIREQLNAESLVSPQPSALQGIRTMTINDGPSPSAITRTIPNVGNGNAPPPMMTNRPSPNFKPNGASPRDQQPQQGNFNAGRNTGPPARNFPIQRMSPQKTPPNKPGILGDGPGSGGRINQMQINSPTNVEPPRPTKIYAHIYQNSKLTTPPPNVPAMVNVCFVKSPSDFYVQYKRYTKELGELMAAIQESAVDASPLPTTPAEMSPCLAIFPEDRQWYRAKVVKLFDDGIGVLFVDFGNTKKLINTRDSLRQLEEKFSKAPAYAVRAKLVDVVPIDGTNTWPQPIKDKFKQLMEFNDFNMDRVRDEEDGTMCVRLKNPNDQDMDIGQMLVSKGVAKSTAATTSQPSDELDPVSKPVPATPPQPVASKPKEPEQVLSVVPAGAAAPGPTPVPPTGRLPSLGAAALLRARMKPIQPIPDSSTDTRSIVKLLKPGDNVMLGISIAWRELTGSAGYLVRSNEQLDDMKALEYHEVVNGVGAPIPGFNLAVGSLISALSPEHGQWFRGCILEVTPNSYSVLYIDYGNVEKGIVSVKPILSDYKEAELGVKMSFGGNNISVEAEKYAAQNFIQDAAVDMEIISLESDGAVVAKLINSGVPDFRIKLEPWAALFEQLKAQQSLPQLPAPPLEIKHRPLEAGFSGDVAVSVVEGLDRIFAQLVSDEAYAALTKVEEILNGLFQKTKAPETVPAIGTYVAAIYTEDQGIYRARVTAVDGNKLTLEYIDYGNTGQVELAQIRALSKEVCDIPCSTFRLSLSLTRRPDGALSDAVKTQLSSLIGQVCSILVLKSSDGLIECTLTKDGQVVNEIISKLLEPPAPPAAPVQAAAPMMPKLETAAPEEANMGASGPVDNTLGTFHYQDGPFQKLPNSGVFNALILTVDVPPLLTICRVDLDMLDKLSKLDEEIATYVGTLPLLKCYEPKEGEVFLARSPVDGFWYRSACLQIGPVKDGTDTKFDCLQVDYGKSMLITKDSILRIPKRFITYLPYMALMAGMKEFAPTYEVADAVRARLTELFPENTTVEMSVINYADEIYVVDIPSVTSQLKAEGLI